LVLPKDNSKPYDRHILETRRYCTNASLRILVRAVNACVLLPGCGCNHQTPQKLPVLRSRAKAKSGETHLASCVSYFPTSTSTSTTTTTTTSSKRSKTPTVHSIRPHSQARHTVSFSCHTIEIERGTEHGRTILCDI
jgi:hypothetical protein